jgi:hypothetical protein
MQNNQTVNVGIASLPERQLSLKKVLDSLTNQADNIFVVLNYGGQEAPEWISDFKNVYWTVSGNEFGGNAKFTMADRVKGYFFTCDDDLIYPANYIKNTKFWIDFYHCIITYHGKRYDGKRPIPSYRKSFTTNIRCLNTLEENTWVHVGGTGVMGFHTDDYVPHYNVVAHKNMADVFLAQDATVKNVQIMAIEHESDFFTYLPPKGKTIWQTTKDDTVQTKILNSFLK